MLLMDTLISIKLLLNAGIAFIVTFACVLILKPIAIKLGLQDLPGGRKHHKEPTPVFGGVCMFIGFCFGMLTISHSLQDYRGFIGAGTLLLLVGVLDDMHELSTKARFIVQIVAGLLMAVWSDNIIHSFGDLLFLGPINLGYLAIPITVFAAVGSINAVNMMDGVDGLLGSTALIQFLFLAYLAWQSNFMISYIMLTLVIAALMAYLIFNFPLRDRPARIFMGDAGSMFIGFCLTWFFISLTQHPKAAAAPVTMLWIFAVPLFDTTWLLIKRSMQGMNPLRPGRDHLHHLLKLTGASDMAITLLISGMTFVFAMLGIIALDLKMNQSVQFLIFISLFIVYCCGINFSWQRLVIASQNNGNVDPNVINLG